MQIVHQPTPIRYRLRDQRGEFTAVIVSEHPGYSVLRIVGGARDGEAIEVENL